jgi:NADH-quinone oxidoreductase subunit L
MIPEAAVWAILGLPLLSFIIVALIIRPFFNDKPKLSSYLTILCIAGSLALSLWALADVLDAGQAEHYKLGFDPSYAFLGEYFDGLSFGVLVDGLSAVMLVVVSLISLVVQIYSLGYMKGDAGYHRYFAFMSLFTMAMLGVVMASNLAMLFVFWELVGLCSYLLIGFWFHKPSAAAAAKKAFIVTRIGDFGFLLGILYLYFQVGTLDIAELHALAVAGVLTGTVLTWAAIGIFAGAVGKSAQFPLHVWLPDAMEGPTPVSSLIHAATMVAAGVYLVARMFPLFMPEPGHFTTQMYVVAIVGAVTAIFAASMALVATDVKRVLAYCTVSQLGYMVLGLGTGAWVIAFFHLFNHAFCKCLLFQGAGSVSHATNTFDMRLMGGLRKGMKWTFWTFLIGCVSMAGIWPLACFWSKDSIVHSAFLEKDEPLIMVCFILAMITVFMTAFYMFRALIMTFFGEYKGGAEPEHGGHGEHHGGIHESPKVMVFALVVLCIFAVGSGWLGLVDVHGGLGNGGFFSDIMSDSPYAEGVDRANEASFAEDNEIAFENAGLVDASGDVSHDYHPPHEVVHVHGDEHAHEGQIGIHDHEQLSFFQMIIPQEGEFPLPLVSVLVAGAGVLLAYLMYGAKKISAESVGKAFKPVYKVFYRKYWMDELYEKAVVENGLYKGVFRAWAWFDSEVVDGVVNGVADFTTETGARIRKLESGQLQVYGLAIILGVLVILACFHIFT